MKKHKINKNHFRVAIFGSARLKKNDSRYKLVHNLAKAIAKENMDVVSGGGPGLMDAASKGHHAGRGKEDIHSVGLTIKLPMEQVDGYHLDIKEDFDRFSGRLDKFMKLSNVVVVAPGGVGTALEFFYTWQLIQVKHICNTPIILLGPMWDGLIKWLKTQPVKKGLISKGDLESIFCVKTVAQAMKIIKQSKIEFDKGGKYVCRNIKKYK
ncbi:LOG family protein [Candidatus Woesearchaeota archaeon]|jgi:uncharacterized protein (TIGR00730 family)|nr:LOG family protein [Candidatus Woesearchaeota archaeon]MBT4150925.1 LOG family protein [Candidatus Woesearchaeota archaeon]MBT4247100.1 LOG family protein [Candidatus Woesearchaeota archaeon]MBT4433715.1 LOG family protein [Candidatus Woesearchaeota archaeon]